MENDLQRVCDEKVADLRSHLEKRLEEYGKRLKQTRRLAQIRTQIDSCIRNAQAEVETYILTARGIKINSLREAYENSVPGQLDHMIQRLLNDFEIRCNRNCEESSKEE